MIRKLPWVLFVTLAISIGLYPVIYFIVDREFGLLQNKSAELLGNVLWNIGFYTHIILGGLALLTGWSQFSPGIRNSNLKRHRFLGKIYVFSVFLSATAGIGIGFLATGGIVSASGFICLGLVWFTTTFLAYRTILQKQIEAHRKWMIYSYAACFAAVTLRIWLPILTDIFHDFIKAYHIVAWLCWVPNLVFAYWITSTSVMMNDK